MSDDADTFAHVLLELHRSPSSDEAWQRLLHYARDVAGCADAGVLMTSSRDQARTAAVTSDLMRRAQDVQISLDEGPCLDAIDEPLDSQHHSPDITRERRWPKWAIEVGDMGYRSALCLPLSTADRRLGSLNLYATEPDAFSDETREAVATLTEHAALAIAVVTDNEGLRVAVKTRQEIGTATGILMERFDIDDQRAFDVLRRYSQDRNVKLRDLAAELVRTRQLPD